MADKSARLDDAARAGWLYYVAGNTQEEIAAKMGISRQSAQRLVSAAISERLIKVRLDHPIAKCMQLADQLQKKFNLKFVDVVPTDPGNPDSTAGVAAAGASEIEKRLALSDAMVMGLGTGRTLKAAIDQLAPMDCPQHTIVSLTGNIAPDGSASFYNVIFNMADQVKARSFPMPLPVIATSSQERGLLHAQPSVANTLALAARADVTFVGIGDLGPGAPLQADGFITGPELEELQAAGAVGEIVGWVFDEAGNLLKGLTNDRVASAALPSVETGDVIAFAAGARKATAILAALKTSLINGLVTDEATAETLIFKSQN